MADTDATAVYTGFEIPNYSQLLDNANTKTKEIFGDDANTDSNSYLGQLNRNMAYIFNQFYMALLDAYFARYIDTAEGTDLDKLGAFFGLPRKPATVATVTLNFTGDVGTIAPSGSLYSTPDNIVFELTDDVILTDDGSGNGVGTGIAESSEKNSNSNVAANQVTVQVEQTYGISTVNNQQQAAGGDAQENDTDYRKRLHASENSKAGPTNSGLYTALYAVSGVKLVKIVLDPINNSNDLALHFYVDGGDLNDIAQCILDNYAFGMVLHGDKSITLNDSGNNPQTIRFDVANSVPVYMQINISTDTDFDSNNGVNDLRTSISNYIADLDMGAKIDYYRLYQIVYNIDGITSADVSIKTDSIDFQKQSIQLQPYDSAIIQSPNNDLVVNINE